MRPMILDLFSYISLRNRSGWSVYRVLHLQTGWCFKYLSSDFLQHVDVSAHFIFVRAKDDGGVLGDEIGFVGLEQRLIEAMPAEGAARFDDLLKGAVFAFAVEKCFACAHTAAHDLCEQ